MRPISPWRAPLCALLALLALFACSGGQVAPVPQPGETISKEVFVETMVEIRVAALRATDRRLPGGAGERILRERGIEEEDLVKFARAWGANPALMTGVWAAIQEKIDSIRNSSDPDEL